MSDFAEYCSPLSSKKQKTKQNCCPQKVTWAIPTPFSLLQNTILWPQENSINFDNNNNNIT